MRPPALDGSQTGLRERAAYPLRRGAWGVRGRLLVAGLVGVVAWGMFAWIHQLRGGLAVTGMRDRVSWGIYIVNFVFFVGMSYGGALVSGVLRLTGTEWRRPITRLAETMAVVALVVGASMIVVDLGRPDRFFNVLRYPHLRSPIVWDVLSISIYLVGTLIYLYLPLVPDVADLRDSPEVGRRRRRLYGWMSLSWAGLPAQRASLDRAMRIMAVVIVPLAISVHTVVAWIFGMTLREGWNSTIFGPYFVIGAVFSGIAGIILVVAAFRRAFRLQDLITERHFRLLGSLLLVLGLLYSYFSLADYLTIGYKLRVGDDALLTALLSGRYAVAFWGFAIAGTIVPILLLCFRRTRTIPGIVVASLLVTIGMWLKRFVIVIPSLALPVMPYEWGVYRPTWVEWSITAGAVAAFVLLFVLFARFFPVISVWEIEEGRDRERQALGTEQERGTVAGRRVLESSDAMGSEK